MKKSKKVKQGKKMTSICKNQLSLSNFIQTNKQKINAITPKNPTLKKDDEWREEECWEKCWQELCKGKKNR